MVVAGRLEGMWRNCSESFSNLNFVAQVLRSPRSETHGRAEEQSD